MTEYRLVPKPRGYYAEYEARNEPTIEADLNYLMSGDDEYAGALWSLRAEVLVVAVDDPPVEPVP